MSSGVESIDAGTFHSIVAHLNQTIQKLECENEKLKETVKILTADICELKEDDETHRKLLTQKMVQIAKLEERIVILKELEECGNNEDVCKHICSVFPSIFIFDGELDQTFILSVDGLRILLYLNRSDSLGQEDFEAFHQEVKLEEGENAVQAGLFVSLTQDRLIHGSMNVYYKEKGHNRTPLIYLGKTAFRNRIVLQLTILLIKRLMKTRIKEAMQIEEQICEEKKPLERKTKEEIITWLIENGNKTITAKELSELMPVSTRNINDLGGIIALRDEAFDTITPRRGRAKNTNI